MPCTRRRFLTVSAVALALPRAALAGAGAEARWRGVALGAEASLTLAGIDPIEARPVFAAMEHELDRLDRIFSLYRDDSALVRLNARGVLHAPPTELVEVLALCDRLWRSTGGAFDPTVQPLWQAMARGGDVAGARALIGWRGVEVSAGAVRLARPGMALTLNGIAQGHITDRIAALLRGRGFGDILVDLGEVAGLGRRADGGAWQAGIAAPDGRLIRRLELSDRALATSAPMAMRLPGGQGHIVAPAGGAVRQALVSVSAASAALADGLSTALCVMDTAAAGRAVAAFAGARIEAMEAA